MRRSLYKSISEQIRKDYLVGGHTELPPIEELSKRYGAAYRTTWKALQCLVAEGKIECTTGRRARVVSSEPAPVSISRSEETIYRRIRENILEGTYKAGTGLPKRDYFVLTYHVGPRAVTGALKKLAAEGLVHKQGKRYIVGPQTENSPVEKSFRGTSREPVVLCILPLSRFIRNITMSSHNERFFHSFSSELLRFGIDLRFSAMYELRLDATGRTDQLENIATLIRKLGRRYRGALIQVGNQFQDLPVWLPRLQEFKRPVVFFDSTDQGQDLVRGNFGLKENYYRLLFNERAAVSLALEGLCEYGHSRIGYPLSAQGKNNWMIQRENTARSIIKEQKLPCTLITAIKNEPFWWSPGSPPSATSLEMRVRDGFARLSDKERSTSIRKRLLNETESLKRLIGNRVTALLCPNDITADEHLQWARIVGLDIPHDMSIVSFDNTYEAVAKSISSIDFGFAHLGYLAARIMVDDIPVRTDAEGNIRSKCTFVSRNSIDKPRPVPFSF